MSFHVSSNAKILNFQFHFVSVGNGSLTYRTPDAKILKAQMGTVASFVAQKASKNRKNVRENKKGGGPGLPASFWFPLSGNSGQPDGGRLAVVCWPAYETPAAAKKFHVNVK
jgi:hypothetical protein